MKKLKYLFTIALLAMVCLSSCSKEDTCIVPVKGDKTIVLKVNINQNSINSRASIEAPKEDQSVVGMSTMDIYFYNKETSVVYSIYSLDNDQIIDATSVEGMSFHGLHSDVNSVAIIVNNDTEKNINIPIDEPITTLFNKPVKVEYEQDFNTVTLHGRNEDGFVNNGSAYTADVEIKPFVARLEISYIQCLDFGNSNFSQLIFRSIFVDQVYEEIGLTATLPQDLFLADENQVLTAGTAGTGANWWIYKYASAENITITAVPFSPEINNIEGAFVFHIIPSQTIDPWVRLHLNATSNTPNAVALDRFVNFKSFKLLGDSEPLKFEAGMIYQLYLPFSEDDVVTFNDNNKNIEIKITAAPWYITSDIIPAR